MSCLELVFVKNLMLFSWQQREYGLTCEKGLITFYFCELYFYYILFSLILQWFALASS